MGRENHKWLPLTEGLFNELTEGDPATDWFRIRDRLWHTLINGHTFWWEIPPDERQKLFNVESNGDGSLPTLDGDYGRFHDGLKCWLAFLFAGIDEAPPAYNAELPDTEVVLNEDGAVDGHRRVPSARFDFEHLLREAVKSVAASRGERVTDFNLVIETEPIESPSPDTETVLESFRRGEPLPPTDILHLVREGKIGKEEVDEYYNRLGRE